MAPQSQQGKIDPVKFGMLLERVEQLVDNVSKQTEELSLIKDRITKLESRPSGHSEELFDSIDDRLSGLEMRHDEEISMPHATQKDVTSLELRIKELEVRRVTITEVVSVLISIVSAIAAIWAVFAK